MHNMVGHHIPTLAEVKKDVKTLTGIRAKLAKSTVKLTSEDRRRAVKMRTGGEEVVRIIMGLAERTGLSLTKASVEDVRRDMTLVERLKPVLEEVEELRSILADTILEAESEAWAATQTYYSSLVRMQSGDGHLESALAPVIDFFSTGRRFSKPEENGNGTNGNDQTPPA